MHPLHQPHTFIKYCGFTRMTDAIYAASLGIDALGFVFYEKSSRYIYPDAAAKIIHAIKYIQNIKDIQSYNNINRFKKKNYAVGLFVNHDFATIENISQKTNIDILQFHGNESADFCEALSYKLAKPYIKAIPLEVEDHFNQVNYQKLCQTYPNASAFLLDKKSQNHGGTGEKINWLSIEKNLWQKNPDFLSDKARIILAGGVFLQDCELLRRLEINSIDLSTGIEIKNYQNILRDDCKGIKSAKLMYQIAKNFA